MPKADVVKRINQHYTDRASSGVIYGITDVTVGSTHDPITLDPDSAPELTLSVQKLKLAEVLTPDEHTVIGNSSPHHAPVTAGNGIAVSGQEVSLDPSDSNTWTGNQIFQGNNTYRHLVPESTDTYDIGSVTRYWRNQWVSQIMATIFAENTAQLIGGAFIIPKDTGLLPAVGSADTTINFGDTMTVGDHLLIKAQDTSGAYKTEYIKVGTLVSGTTYNVTRDEASANDPDPAWPDGTPYAVLGQTGNGWIQLDATTTPRMSIFTQSANYNDQTEVVRLGDINGLGGISSTTWGAYFGAADKAYMTVDPTNGLQLKTSNDKASFDANGISFNASGSYDDLEGIIKFYNPSTNKLVAQWMTVVNEVKLDTELTSTSETGRDSEFTIRAHSPKDKYVNLHLWAESFTSGIGKGSYLNLIASSAGSKAQFQCDTVICEEDLQYKGALQSYKNSTAYTGYIYVPLATPLTSTSWDGDAYSSKSATKIDMSSVFGAPANMKAVKLRVLARDSVTVHTDNTIRMDFSNVGTGTWTHALWPIGGDFWAEKEITVPCNADGDIYYDIKASGASTFDVHIQVLGYYI